MENIDLLLKKRSGPLVWQIWAFLLFVFILMPTGSRAATITGNSTTYLQASETLENNRIVPLYEYLDLHLNDLGAETVSFHFGGWARFDLTDNDFEKRYDNDLQYAYLSFRNKTDNSVVNVGRVMVFDGVAAERVDGLYTGTDLKGGFGVSAYVGSPVESPTDEGGDLIYGGRISHQVQDLYKIGVSYLKEDKDSNDFREEEGVDLWLRPVKYVELIGKSDYNSQKGGWMEHTYYLSIGPLAALTLYPEVSWIDYRTYFTAYTLSAFAFQPGGLLDPNEKLLTLGGRADYTLTPNVILSAEYRNYNYDIAGSADYYGGKVAYSVPDWGGAGAAYHRMSGETDRLKYNEYHVYVSKKFGGADLTADFFDVKYDRKINGIDNAYSAALSAGYELNEKMKLAADVDYSRNPDFDKDVRALVKVLYRFGTSGI